jgi:hypothetical protein
MIMYDASMLPERSNGSIGTHTKLAFGSLQSGAQR